MKKVIFPVFILISLLLAGCGQNVEQDSQTNMANNQGLVNNAVNNINQNSGPSSAGQELISVSQLLANPQYNAEIKVYGEIADFDMLDCTCFRLIENGAILNAWYDSMTDGQGNKIWPAVDITGFQNGDQAALTGEFVSKESKDFWIKKIEKFK
ncbi:hypothetical protein KJ840_00670 [Patescibacteria group bacterium]|nr:hypothetical protein [Patescibacteria group bacterium]